jgi:TRAP-type C4-dicarboxylate transport system permease small subunit
MERAKTARNVAIVALIAAAVYFVPGGGRAANTFEAALVVGFACGLAYLGLRLYREHRIAVHSLGDRHRGLLYGALAVGMLAVAGRARMWQTGFGELLWFVLMGIVAYTLVAVYRYWRTY